VEEDCFRLVLLKVRGNGAGGRRAGAAHGERRRSVLHAEPVESPPGEREVSLSGLPSPARVHTVSDR